jgi:hypothetical protein
MKRSSSETTFEEDKPNITHSKKIKKSPQKVKPENGEWDPEKRAVFMDLIIAAGYKAINLDEVVSTVSLPQRKIWCVVRDGKETISQSAYAGEKGKFPRESGFGCQGRWSLMVL